jgi:low temperature requirement protein LtrA
MSPRDPEQEHRAATPLELFFDLTFVAAVALAGAGLEHGLATGHPAQALAAYPIVFFAIWWAWMNFTWFASAYDTDDAPYRIAVLVQMTGVLIVAAGISRAFRGGWHLEIITAGYVVMRLAMVALWLRAAVADPAGRRCALRYAVGVATLQVLWVARLALPAEGGLASFLALAALEMMVPIWAEAAGRTSWHPRHIAERYGLFTIILLGESVLAASRGVAGAVESSEISMRLVVIAVSGLVLLFAFWWLYFLAPAGAGLSDHRHRSYLWGYGHYGIFAALAALGAGLEVTVERTGHDLRASDLAVCYAIAIPAAVFLLLLWLVNAPITAEPIATPAVVLGSAGVILFLPLATPRIGLAAVVAAIAAVNVLMIVFALTRKSGR